MPSGSLVIVGAGGHADVVRAAAEASGWRIAAHVDETVACDAIHRGVQMLGGVNALDRAIELSENVHVAIGNNAVRERLASEVTRRGARLTTIVHPSAFVDPSATVEAGTAVLAVAAINPLATIGTAVIVNTGAIVEHHCHLDDAVHVAPGAVMGGHCRIGAQALIGLGARLRDRIAVGANALVGTGAVVVSDVGEDATVIGVPARAIRHPGQTP